MVKAAGPGGNVLMRADAGAYDLAGSITISSGGTAGAPVTIKGVAFDGSEQNITINGTRPQTWDPLNPAGNEIFRISGNGSNLVFENMSFKDVKTAFHVISDVSNITIKDMAAGNVERFFDDLAGGKYKIASIDGLTIENVDVTGFSKGVVRLQYDTKNVVIRDVHGNSGNLDGANFAIGVHIDGTAHGILIKDSSMGNITDTTSYYWNGDGFATEGGVYDVRFEDTRAYGNTDAGYDLKSATTVLVNAVAEDNKKNFRLWGDETLINATSKNPQMRGGSGEQLHVQVMGSGAAKIIGGTFTDASNGTTVIKIEGGTLDIRGTSIVHAAGAQLINVANPASVVKSDGVQVANVPGLIGASIGWSAGHVVYGTTDANVLVKAIAGNEVFVGSSAIDTFFFDTSNGHVLGEDTIRNFGLEDRIVTTAKLVDRDVGPQVTVNRSDQFISVDENMNIKLFGANGKAISKVTLVDTIDTNGIVKYVYAAVNATGDTSVAKALLRDGYDRADAVRNKLLHSVEASSPVTVPVSEVHGSKGGSTGTEAVTETVPATGSTTVPEQSVPEATPVQTAPTTPEASHPVETTPVQTVPVETAPVQTAPVETTPVQTSPVQTVPVETAPVQTVPVQTAPAPVLVYNVTPNGAIKSTGGDDKLAGTSGKDIFFFDTASGASFGNDTIRNFSTGDRIVTTSKIFDANHDGRIKANSSDRLVLPTAETTDFGSSGSVKIFNQNGKAVSNIALVDSYVEHGHTYYVYGAQGDLVSGASLTFASQLVDNGLFA
jgi:hypothetical protein